MNTVNLPTGTTVYVTWYGHVVQAEVTDRKGRCDWEPYAEWIPVLMTVPNSEGKPIVEGCRNICMFHMHHVYATPDEAQEAWQQYQEEYANRHAAADTPATVPVASAAGVTHPDIGPSVGEFVTLTVAKQRYLNFKAAHWDAERNHLSVDALDDFYQLWCDCIAEKRGLPKSKKAPSQCLAVQPQRLPPEPPPPAPHPRRESPRHMPQGFSIPHN